MKNAINECSLSLSSLDFSRLSLMTFEIVFLFLFTFLLFYFGSADVARLFREVCVGWTKEHNYINYCGVEGRALRSI